MLITPTFVVSFETNMKTIVENNWKNVSANLYWDRLMKTRPSESKKEILYWMLNTAKIYPEGNGGNTRFDDMVGFTTSYENDNAGAGFRLTRNEIDDNHMTSTGQGVLDSASQWASDIGNAAAFYPQQALLNLITNGKTATGYDGVPFFSASHPLNPGGGGGTYSNIITAATIVPTSGATELENLGIAQTNFAKALAAVRSKKFLNGVPRYLKPEVLVVPTALQYRAQQLLGAGVLGQTTNILTSLGMDIIVDPLLDAEPTVYYIGVADMMAGDLGPFIWSDRKPFSMNTYTADSEAELNRRDEFEWTMKGRNAAIYGHPYLMYRVEPT